MYERPIICGLDLGVPGGDRSAVLIYTAEQAPSGCTFDTAGDSKGYAHAPATDDGIRQGVELYVQKDLTFFVIIDDHGNAVSIHGSYQAASDELCAFETIIEVDGQGFVRA
jgi:hypothetical protein